MRYRKLRIAFSATCLIACVLLIVLWVRSYQTIDHLNGHLPGITNISSSSAWGRVTIRTLASQWTMSFHWMVLDENSFGKRPKEPRSWFNCYLTPVGSGLEVPHGFLVLLAITVGTLPWLNWRFRLHTLLIATTLVAVVLGLAVYASRG
jgi:hypothetical protein